MASTQEQEMTSLKEEFRGRSRIVEEKKGDGVIRNVTVQPKNMDVTIKFTLSESYPVTAPDIHVRATCMEEEQAVELKGMLKVKVKQYLNQPMISSLVSDAEKWLITNGLGKSGKPSEYWKDKLRPNYFLAIRITNPEIIEVTKGIQDSILNSQSIYKKFFSAPASLYITLCTLGLDTEEQVDSAVKALHNIHDELKVLVPRQSLKLNGVSHFNNRVVYAKVEYPPEFLEFVEHIEMCLRLEGIEFRRQHGAYVPHMTIMKTTRPISRRMGTANIDPKLYKEYSGQYFGEVPVDAVYLCSIEDPRQPDGFCVSPTHIVF